jgi:hypothetical protein
MNDKYIQSSVRLIKSELIRVFVIEEISYSLISRALRGAALAVVLAPGLAAAQSHYHDGYAERRHYLDAEDACTALAEAVEGERVFHLPLPNGDHQRILHAAGPGSRPGRPRANRSQGSPAAVQAA